MGGWGTTPGNHQRQTMSDLTTPALVNRILTFLKDKDRDTLIMLGAAVAHTATAHPPGSMWGAYHRALDEALLIVELKGLSVEDEPVLWDAIVAMIESAFIEETP